MLRRGSVLGPDLFLVYINDISDNLKSFTIKLLVDDALLYCSVNILFDSENFQQDLNILEQWADTWRMAFNTDNSPNKIIIIYT